jgi:tuftelin-interacting protein 11
MAEDPKGFEPFNLDNDFEDGQWINGEFFYTREKRKRKPTKEELIYGVFGESSDSDSDSKSHKKSKRKE